MKPLNQSDRQRAFFSFLTFFCVTIGLIVTLLLFSFQVPFKENNKLRKEIDLFNSEKAVLKSFDIHLLETLKALDSVNLVDNPFVFENKIQRNLRSMDELVTDTLSMRNLCINIIDNVQSLQEAKREIRKINNSDVEIAQKEKEIEKLEQRIKHCELMFQQSNISR